MPKFLDDIVFADDTSQDTAAGAAPYDLYGHEVGLFTSSQLVWHFVAPREFDLRSVLFGSVAHAVTAPDGGFSGTVDASFDINVNGTGMWFMIFAVGFNVAFFADNAASGDTTINAGDVITITAPSVTDTSLASVAWTLMGTL